MYTVWIKTEGSQNFQRKRASHKVIMTVWINGEFTVLAPRYELRSFIKTYMPLIWTVKSAFVKWHVDISVDQTQKVAFLLALSIDSVKSELLHGFDSFIIYVWGSNGI